MERLISNIWNSLFYGVESRIVQHLERINEFDRWIAVYDIFKAQSPFIQDFIKEGKSKYCIIVFKYKANTNLLEEGFDEKDFEQEYLEYVSSKEEIIRCLDYKQIDENLFTYAYKVEYPLGT